MKRNKTLGVHPMANQFLGLALFIMLLSFFLVLNALSSFKEDKVKSALTSLDVAFSAKALEQDPEISIRQSDERKHKKGDVLEQLQGHFQSHLSGMKVKRNRLGTELYMILPARDFERLIAPYNQNPLLDISLDADQSGFLKTMVSIMQSENTDRPYRVDILLSAPEKPSHYSNEEPEALRALLERSSKMTEILEGAGIPKKFMSAGLIQGQENMVELFFRRHVPLSLKTLELEKL